MTPADLHLANRLADAAGEAIRPFFRADFASESKADASPVTEADRAAETAMRRLLDAEAPRDGVHGEEFGVKEGTTGRTWVLDPIDGTVSFMAGRPIFGTLIALMEDGWPVLGIIDQPIGRERWVGAAGKGTTFNGAPVHVRTCPGTGAGGAGQHQPEPVFGCGRPPLHVARRQDRARPPGLGRRLL